MCDFSFTQIHLLLKLIGIVTPEGRLTLDSTTVNSTAAELNLLDGSMKSTSSITIADTDAFLVLMETQQNKYLLQILKLITQVFL